MKRTLITLGLMMAIAAPLGADATIKSTTTGKGMGMSAHMESVTYLKGMKMRVDNIDGSTTKTVIWDVENQKMVSFDNKKKEADVWDMATLREDIDKAVQPSDVEVSVKPNGQTKQTKGGPAAGYDIRVTVPFAAGGGGGGDMKMTMVLSGHAWVVKGSPGTADWAAFYKAADEKGFIFTSDPKATRSSPSQSKAQSEMYHQFASMDGVAWESDMDMKGEGGGMLGAMMSRMGFSGTSVVQSVETAPIPDAMFAPPAGYRINQRK